MISKGIDVSLIDINKSGYMFEPNQENDTILYGMKAISGVNGEIIQEIVNNRPYNSLEDFMSKVKCNKTVMVSLIKSGAFDQFDDRNKIMREYIWSVCEPKKRITMQNFNGLNERGLLSQELDFQKRLFSFNKGLRKNYKIDGKIVFKNRYYDFYEEFFDVDELEPYGNALSLSEKKWKKMYDNSMKPAKDYISVHKEELLKALNNNLFQEMWNKYAAGNYSQWEMDSLGFYYHEHELENISDKEYDIEEFDDLSKEPVIEYTFKRNGMEIPIYRTYRIAGTVIAKEDSKSCISLLTKNSGVVTVKMNRDTFAYYNKRISEMMEDGSKKVREPGFFQRGTKLVLNGFRRGEIFMLKTYKKSLYHKICKITEIKKDGTFNATHLRYGETEE